MADAGEKSRSDHGGSAVTAANHAVRIEALCEECVANFKSISIAAGEGKPVALKAKGKYWVGEKSEQARIRSSCRIGRGGGMLNG